MNAQNLVLGDVASTAEGWSSVVSLPAGWMWLLGESLEVVQATDSVESVLDILWHELDDALLALEETVELTVPPLDLA